MNRYQTAIYCLLSMLLFCLLYSCNTNQKRNIKAYYLPLEELSEGKVYEYHPIHNDSLPPFYWYFRLFKQRERTILTSTYYDYKFEIQQLNKEEIVKNGVILNELSLYGTDTLTGKQTPHSVRVEWDNAFPFEVSDSTDAFLYKIYWTDVDNPQQKIRLIRNKHFMGDATYTYQGRQVDCVRFLVKELLEIEEVGFQELTYTGTELYAKDIGLVYFNKKIDGAIVQEYELAERYDMKVLEDRFRDSLEEINLEAIK